MFAAPTSTAFTATATETYTAGFCDERMMLPRPSWMELELPEEMPDSLRCAYASKRCDKPRTIKKSGGLHRFCAFHRERANRNQWRVDHRRRLLKKSSVVRSQDTPRATQRRGRSPRCFVDFEEAEAEAASLARREARRQQDAELSELSTVVDTYEVCNTREAKLNEQDVAILRELLFVDDVSTPVSFHADAQLTWPPFPSQTDEELTPPWSTAADATFELLYAATV